MIDELEIIFPLNSNPTINRLERIGDSEPHYRKWCELEGPIRSTLQPEVVNSRLMYGRYAQISSNSAFLLYMTQDRKLLQYKLSDIRKKIIKPECLGVDLEDFCWDEKGVVTLSKSGEVCTWAGETSGPWMGHDAIWTALTKFENDWIIVGWQKSNYKHYYVRLDSYGTWKATRCVRCHNMKNEKNSKII